jgi:hypothetical protein
MNGPDRELIERLVPHMRRIPGRLETLLSQILMVRRAYEGRNVSLSEYKENLERELDRLEHEGREITSAAVILKGILAGPNLDDLIRAHRILDEANGGGDDV